MLTSTSTGRLRVVTSASRARRVLHVLTEPRGGGGVYAETLAHAAANRGWSVSFAVPEPVSDAFPSVPLRATSTAWIAEARRASLVHYHGVRSGLLQPLMRPRRSIVTPHGLHALQRTRPPARYLARALTRKSLGWATAVVCVSSDELRTVTSMSSALRRRAHLIFNGVAPVALPSEEDRLHARRALGLSPDAKVLAFVGGLRFQKHPELAVAAAKLATQKGSQIVLLVVGEGPLHPVVSALADESVRVLGQRTDVHRILVASDVVLNTSRWEGLSIALLEALWLGRPVVATDAPGNADAVGDAGFVVEQRADALADAVVRLLDTPGLAAELGRKARARAELLFGERVMIEKTLTLYEDVLAARG